MERREMLEESFRGLARALPAALAAAGGLGGLLWRVGKNTSVARPQCFPKRYDEPGNDTDQEGSNKEEEQR